MKELNLDNEESAIQTLNLGADNIINQPIQNGDLIQASLRSDFHNLKMTKPQYSIRLFNQFKISKKRKKRKQEKDTIYTPRFVDNFNII